MSWYAKGLRFKCSRCSHCCTGPQGYVWLSPRDQESIARPLGLEVGVFLKRYVRLVGRLLSLVDKPNGDCIFLTEDKRCAIHAVKHRLVGRLPALSALSAADRKALLTDMHYIQAPEGAAIVRQGEVSDAAYFILEGGAIAGRQDASSGQDHVLEVLNAGDFFGEIAALTGLPRTANVVTDKAAVLLRVPASTLRQMSRNPDLNRLLMSKMTERMIRMDMIELPKMLAYDQRVLRDLRTREPEAQTA